MHIMDRGCQPLLLAEADQSLKGFQHVLRAQEGEGVAEGIVRVGGPYDGPRDAVSVAISAERSLILQLHCESTKRCSVDLADICKYDGVQPRGLGVLQEGFELS
jgi:hypothetical protein